MPTFSGRVRRSLGSQSTLRNRREHLSLDPGRLAWLGLPPGSQVRVRRTGGDVALYTVTETRHEPDDTTVRMALVARQRLGTEDEFDAVIDSQVPRSALTDDEARAQSEFVERIEDDGCQRGLVVLAPHGGAIERHTDRQAQRLAATLGRRRASAWWCKGFKTGGGAFDAWHVTSSDISDASFPLLKAIAARGFAHAVAFHGTSEPEVVVGGSARPAFKREIAAAVGAALGGSGIRVRIAERGEAFDGDDPRNVVNRLTAGGTGGVQIEQPIDARERFWMGIADAVACVYHYTLPRPRAASLAE